MKVWLRFVSWFNRKAKNFSIRLVKWTGKSKEYVHPKHLISDKNHYWFLPFLKLEDTVLDLGCGGGAHSLIAAGSVKFIKGIDYSERNLAIAKRLAEDRQIKNIDFKLSSLEELIRETDNTYSAILALDILEHLINRDQFLNEVYRILAPGGRLYLSVPNCDTKWKHLLQSHHLFYYSDLDHKHEYTKLEIEELLTKHQFQMTQCEPTVYDTPWVGLIDILGGISLSLYARLAHWKRTKVLKNPEEATGFRIVAEKRGV